MSFLHPEFMYYMLPPLFILFGLLLTQKEAQEQFFSKEVMEKLRVSANTLTLKARNALFLLMAIFMIIALAQPVLKDGTIKIKAKSADIMIALDISDSMLATDIYPNRLEAAKQKALTLLESAPNERIGVIAFARNSYLVSPLSFDSSSVAFLLAQLDTSSITEKGTDFMSVLKIVIETQKEQEKKYLLILSDGGDKSDFSQEINLAKDNGLKVFVLAVATKKGAPIKQKQGGFIKHNGDIIISKLNENIASLAIKTGGTYIQSTTSDKDIKRMFKEITNKSDKREFKSEEIPRYTQLFYYPLSMAIFLLLIATSSLGRNSLHVAVLLSLVFIFKPLHVEASMLDFMEINKAKEAYERGEYEKSAKMYENFANTSTNGQSYYNAANSYYKQKKYKKAIENYTKATFDKDDERALNYSNLGNAYAKNNNLKKAIESYKKSLKINYDKDTKENLEVVKKMIKKEEQKNKDDKNKDKKEGEKKDSDENQKNSSDEEKSKNEKDSSESKDSKDKEQNKEDMKAKEEDKKNKDAKEKKEREDKLEKLDDKKEKNIDKSKQEASSLQKQIMSDAEEKKWIKLLNLDSKTYLYKLNNDKAKPLGADEKPW